MPGRSRPTFTKRQKEHARQEKQRAKAQRKLQRKLEKQAQSSMPAETDAADRDESAATPESADMQNHE